MKIKFGLKSYQLYGKPLQKGAKVDFSATKNDLSTFHLASIKGRKVISVVPSLDTSVCATQTSKIAQLQTKFKDVTFITISLDLPFAQARWCGANAQNVIAVSDYKTREFGKQTGFLITDLALLARGLIILDAANTVLAVQYVPNVGHEPNYDLITEHFERT